MHCQQECRPTLLLCTATLLGHIGVAVLLWNAAPSLPTKRPVPETIEIQWLAQQPPLPQSSAATPAVHQNRTHILKQASTQVPSGTRSASLPAKNTPAVSPTTQPVMQPATRNAVRTPVLSSNRAPSGATAPSAPTFVPAASSTHTHATPSPTEAPAVPPQNPPPASASIHSQDKALPPSQAAAPSSHSSTHPILIQDPDYLQKVKPDYPEFSREDEEEGTVLVKLLIDENGYPQHLSIAKSSSFPALDQAALKAAQKSRFKPRKENGQAHSQWVLVPYLFKLND